MAYISSLKKVFVAGCLLAGSFSYAWQTLIGNDSSRTNQTFSFGIKAHYAQLANYLVMVGAESAGQGKEFSLSKISLSDNKVSPCAPEQAMVNGIYDQPNPLYNAQIQYVVCPNATQVVAYNPAYKSTLYLTNHYGVDAEVFSVEIKDEAGVSCTQVMGLETTGDNIIFAAVKVGENNRCAIALISYSEKTEKVEILEDELKKMEKEVVECKNDEKKIRRLKKGLEIGQDGKPYRNVTTKKITQEKLILLPENCKDVTSLCWHSGVNCLYIGGKYNTPINDQACGILVGRLHADKVSMSIEPFTHRYLDIFQNGSIDTITQCNTSTGALDYLLVKNSNTPYQIHSMALCNQRILSEREEFKFQGKLADAAAKPVEIFISTRNKFLGRQFAQPFASNPDAPALISFEVGYGPLYAGPIQDIMVRGDVIFAVVSESINGYCPGIYQSQALYDEMGKISGWTFWQKTLEQDGIDFALINNAKANMMIFGQDSGGEKGTRTVQVNKWPERASDEIAQLIEIAHKEFVESKQEIKKVFDFSILTPGLLSKNITLLMADTKLMLSQMPNFDSVTFEYDSFKVIGTPTCAQIGISDEQGWLFLGGTNGLARMVDSEGAGWGMPQGMHHISQLQGMHAEPVGNYTMVRKILLDQGYLYVLTDTQFDRIDLRTNQITNLAGAEKLCNQRYSIFYDVIVSNKCALLATSAGLYRVGNGKNCMHDDATCLNWTFLKVPEATDLSLFLIPLSSSGNPHDWAKGSGQVYIITGSYTKKGAHVHRFAVQDVMHHEITDSTIMPVPDLVFKDRISDIGALLACSDCFSTDGLFYLAPFKQKKSKPMLLYNGLTKARTAINLELEVDDKINCITRNSMHGNWLIAGTFGLKTNI